MDFISHGLWGYLAINRYKPVWLAILIGMLPDVISFGPYFIYVVFSGNMKFHNGPPPLASIPKFVFVLYDITHSLLIFAAVFLIAFYILKKLPIILIPWGLHILMDIPTHTKEFFPTKFLYPLTDFSVSGIAWAAPWFIILNYSLLLVCYAILLIRQR